MQTLPVVLVVLAFVAVEVSGRTALGEGESKLQKLREVLDIYEELVSLTSLIE